MHQSRCVGSNSNVQLLLFIDKEELKAIVKSYFDRMLLCEGQKWDLEHEVRKKEYEVIIESTNWSHSHCLYRSVKSKFMSNALWLGTHFIPYIYTHLNLQLPHSIIG